MNTASETLSLGFSPCPNDTFIFHALVHGIENAGDLRFQPRLEDVQTLNELALSGDLDVTKVSVGVLPYLLHEYTLLRSGGALGRGCGPLVVAREPLTRERVSQLRIAIPGRHTTANLLWQLYAPEAPKGIELTYDRIMPAVEAGEVDAGLIIHESRFTYPDHGLVQVVDLGEWWEQETGAPIPLGAIVARRSLGRAATEIEAAIARSVRHAYAVPADSAGYIAAHAQEMSPAVTQSHIDLYVNDFSIDLGSEGEKAVRLLIDRAIQTGLIPDPGLDPFERFPTM